MAPTTDLAEILRKRSAFVLRRIRSQHGPGEQVMVGVVCDNCQRSCTAPSIEQLVPKLGDWYVDPEIGSERDLCPDCVRRS